ncbi:hypothetical protein JOM56_007313 [Amanita muscaria]
MFRCTRTIYSMDSTQTMCDLVSFVEFTVPVVLELVYRLAYLMYFQVWQLEYKTLFKATHLAWTLPAECEFLQSRGGPAAKRRGPRRCNLRCWTQVRCKTKFNDFSGPIQLYRNITTGFSWHPCCGAADLPVSCEATVADGAGGTFSDLGTQAAALLA